MLRVNLYFLLMMIILDSQMLPVSSISAVPCSYSCSHLGCLSVDDLGVSFLMFLLLHGLDCVSFAKSFCIASGFK